MTDNIFIIQNSTNIVEHFLKRINITFLKL